jgi:hypothetical protein
MLRLDARKQTRFPRFVYSPDARPHSQTLGVVAREKLRYRLA